MVHRETDTIYLLTGSSLGRILHCVFSVCLCAWLFLYSAAIDVPCVQYVLSVHVWQDDY